jgi:diguanylate cyclase (GGDEF)-like protein/PAS domain S-box-containing protein
LPLLSAVSRRLASVAEWAKPSLLPATIAASVILTAGILYERQNEQAFHNDLQNRVAGDLALVAARLQGEVNNNVASLRNVADMFSVAPEQASRQFGIYARKLMVQNSHFRRVGAAPGGVVRQAFPPGRNDRYLGTDFNRFHSFRMAARTDRSRGRPLMLGPVQFARGGRGFNLFMPVFTNVDARRYFWGYIDGLIDEDKLYRDAGLLDVGHKSLRPHNAADIKLAIRDISVPDNIVDPFFGDAEIFDDEPVVHVLDFPGGRWELAAVPSGGWSHPPANLTEVRLIISGAALLIIVPIFLTGGLVSERQRNIAHLRARERQVQSLSQRLDIALDASKIGIWEIELQTGARSWDAQMHRLHGFPEAETPGEAAWRAALHPDDVAMVEAEMELIRVGGNEYKSQYRIRAPEGGWRHIRNVGSRLAGPNGEDKLTGISWDVTEDVLLNEALKAAKEHAEVQNAELAKLTQRLDLALDSYECGMWETDLEDGLTLWDERMHQLYGIPNTGRRISRDVWLTAVHPDDRAEAERKATEFVREKAPYTRTSRVVHPDGSVRYMQTVGKLHLAQDGRKLIGLAFDVTEDVILKESLKAAKEQADRKNRELEQAKTRIEHNALHDPLTGLGNRRKLDSELNGIAEISQGADVGVGILHIDLDRFKQINDTLGHAAGDALLVHAAEVLRASARESDLVARIGGDEFVVVVTDTTDEAHFDDLARQIIALMQQPVEYQGHVCRFGVSIGIAHCKGRSIDTGQLLINADIALYRAKALGRNRHEYFTEELQAAIVSTKRIADDILSGIENNEFVPYYQPQIDAGTLQLAGAEALIRWNHPREGLLAPDHFLAIAEDLNVMATLDRIMLEKALLDRVRWAAQGLLIPKISVNVSARRLRDSGLIDSLSGLAITPGQICFELVESIFLDESDDVVLSNLEQIKALGIDIEIDDFGTGHTSIVSLLKLKPKRLKIDRQLVAPILSSRHEQALVRSIIEIGRSLGIEIVAEGVETMQHAEMLGLLGCDLLQGYAFARPLSQDAFLAFSKEMRRKVAS